MGYSLADGQLAATAGTILTGGPGSKSVNATFANTSGSLTETVLVFLTRPGSTARRIARFVLLPNEVGFLQGAEVGGGDLLTAQASDAATVDYVVYGTSADLPAVFDVKTLDSTGAAKPAAAVVGSGGNLLCNFRNLIDGGDFTVNPFQRGTTFTAIANSLTYTADRFFAVGGASSSISVSQQAQTDVPGFGNSLRWGRGGGTNTATINLGQVLESGDCIRAQGQQVTLSFWAKAGAQFSAAGGLLAVVLNHSTTAGNDTAAHLVAASTNWQAVPTVINGTAAVTSTATRFTFTGNVPSNCTQLGLLFSYAPVGTNNTTDTVDFYGVQLEVGSAATVFEHRDLEVELALCQRYFFSVTEANGAVLAIGAPSGTNTQSYSVWLPTPMRVAPTVIATVGGFKVIVDGAAAAAATGLAAGSAHSPTIITLVTTVTLSAAAHSIILQGSGTTGSVTASAEF